MQPTLLFPFIHTYGLMLAIGFYAAWYLASRRARLLGERPDVIGDLVLVSILAGVAGARILYFALYRLDKEPLWAIVKVWDGGLVFYGGLVGAALADALYLRWRGINAWRIADAAAPAIALGQAFGRIGCFLNGCCFGGPATARFPLAVSFPRIPGAEGKPVGSPPFLEHLRREWIAPTATHSLPIHPTQLYTAAGLFLIAALLVAATPHRRHEGQLLGLLFLLHGLLRFPMEFVRDDTAPVLLGLNPGHLGAVAILLGGLLLLAWATRRGAPLPNR